MTFAIHVLPESLARTASGAITGAFWLEVEGVAFPAAGWNDFVDPALLDGLRELFGIQSRIAGSARLGFMDGPYEARFHHAGGADVEVRLIEGGAPSDVKVIPVAEVRWAMREASAALLAGYALHAWDKDELARYATALAT